MSVRARIWAAAVAGAGAVAGVAPHVLHHVGPLAGAALLAGAGGTVLFGVLGLAASVPFLLRLRRRFRTWVAPAVALAAFAAMFAVSTVLVAPLFVDDTRELPPDHAAHHPAPLTDTP